MSYLKRVEALEQKIEQQDTPGPVFIICLDASKDADGIERPIDRMHTHGETYTIEPGESPEEFKERSVREAKKGLPSNSTSCFICCSREGSTEPPPFGG